MFLHGLESGPNGLKAYSLKKEYKNFYCPNISNPKNIWKAFSIVRKAIIVFQPDIIIGSSYGSILLILLIQFGIWTKGRSIILACAMGLVAKHRMYFPDDTKNIIIVHGLQDKICDIRPVRKMALQYNIEMIEIDDGHSLKTICDESKILINLINKLLEKENNYVCNNQRSELYYNVKLTIIIVWALLRWPFNKYLL